MQNPKSNFPKFMLLWTGEFISAIGSGLTSFGLGVYVFDQTGSAGSMALVTLLEPSYRATVTDLLTKEEYSKAGGMVGIAGSVRYLISPVPAGALLVVSDIRLLLVIDICTFFSTVPAAAAVLLSMLKSVQKLEEPQCLKN